MNPTYQSALTKAGAASGLGLGALLSGASEVMDSPRRWLWDALGLGENGGDLVRNQLGIDPDSLAGMVIGNGAEMLLDPMNLLGPLGGALGKAVGTGLDVSKSVVGKRASLAGKLAEMAGEREALGRVGSIAKNVIDSPGDIRNWPSPTFGSSKWSVPDPEMFASPVRPKGPLDFADKAYNRVSPDALAALERSGLGVARQGSKGGAMMTGEIPPFLKGKGGVMGLDQTYRVPEYAASFSPIQSVAEKLAPEEIESLAAKLAGSADLLDAPLADVGSLAARRLESIGLDEGMVGDMLAKVNATPTPFNLSANPRISEDMANRMANLHTGGIAAAMAPFLGAPLPQRQRPEWEQIGVMPQEFMEPIGVMPSLVRGPVDNGYDQRRREELARMGITPRN